jgi:hypothetical protein
LRLDLSLPPPSPPSLSPSSLAVRSLSIVWTSDARLALHHGDQR